MCCSCVYLCVLVYSFPHCPGRLVCLFLRLSVFLFLFQSVAVVPSVAFLSLFLALVSVFLVLFFRPTVFVRFHIVFVYRSDIFHILLNC